MTDFDENRQLCSDGNCLGVLVDGRCNVCGLGGAGAETPPEAHVATLHAADDGGFDEDRQLCPDGACTGILGSDGKCKACGRSAAS